MRNRRRRRMHHSRLRNLIIWVGLIIIPLLLLLLWDEVENLVEKFQSENTATQEPLYVQDVNRPMYNRDHPIKEQKDGELWPRVYPYSVVEGGVHSVQELQSAMWRDPVVAKHYSNFKLDRARVIEARADRTFHVSYRIGDEIFWTKKRLKVAKGERLITDDTNFTRTRCANVLSDVPHGKTSPDEPTAEVLDTPTLPPPGGTPIIPPVVVAGGMPDPSQPTLPPSGPTPFMPPVVLGGGLPGPTGGGGDKGGNGDSEGNAPAPVPEPTTLLLLGSGLAGLWGFRKKFKK